MPMNANGLETHQNPHDTITYCVQCFGKSNICHTERCVIVKNEVSQKKMNNVNLCNVKIKTATPRIYKFYVDQKEPTHQVVCHKKHQKMSFRRN